MSLVSRTISVKHFGFEKVKLERNTDKFGREFGGVNFLGGLQTLEKQGRKTCERKMPSISLAIFLKFARPKLKKKIYRKCGIRTQKYDTNPAFMPYEPFLLGVGVVLNLLKTGQVL